MSHSLAIAGALLVSALVLGVAAEWALRRAIRSGRYYVWPPRRRQVLMLDRRAHPQLEPYVRIEINRDGERGGGVPRAGRTFRVLVAGGSAVECYLLDQDATWPGVLERKLQRPEHIDRLGADRVHVGNIGRSGVDSQTLDLILKRVLPNYDRLDLIIIMVGASDVVRWLMIGAPADRAAPPVPLDRFFSRYPEVRFGWSPRRWALAEWVRRLRDLRPTRQANACSWYVRYRLMRAQASEVRDELPEPTVMLRAFEHHFRSILGRARAHAGRVLVVRQPWFEKEDYTADELALLWSGGVGEAYYDQISIYYSNQVINKLMAQINSRVVQVAGEMGVEQHDLMALIERSAASFIDHFHFTAAACEVIAEAVCAAIVGPAEGKDPIPRCFGGPCGLTSSPHPHGR
ncbi:MAG TPA: hypothetical protein VF590_15340 [Isosphaeraceae bacterium]|jgi:lysophospholipase L1-like esterase